MTSPLRPALATVLALVVAAAAVSCGEEDLHFGVKYAPGFVKDGNSISVFGVFKDGRMNPEAWDEVGARFSAALHKDHCEVAISNTLRTANGALFRAVDGVARADGVTDELLDKFSASASGDSILVIAIAGHPPQAKDGGGGGGSSRSTPAASPMSGGRGGRRGGGMRQPSPNRTSGPAPSVFEMSASLFSKAQHQSVALVDMTYTGPSEEEATRKFIEKLAASFPGAVCSGWTPEIQVDDEAIRRLEP